jgi:hypothetical protein
LPVVHGRFSEREIGMTESKKDADLTKVESVEDIKLPPPKPSRDVLDPGRCRDSFFHQLGRLTGMCDKLLEQAGRADVAVDAHSALEAVSLVLTNASKMIIQVAYLKSHAYLWKLSAEAEAKKLEEQIRTELQS